MSDAIIKVLDKLGQQFGMAIDWSANNVMPYVQQLSGKVVRYEISMSSFWIVVAIIALIFSAWLYKKAKYVFNEVDDGLALPMYFIVLVVVCLGIGTILKQSTDIITAVTLPEKTIIQNVQTIMNNDNK